MQQKVPFSLIRCSSSKVAFCSCVEWGWHIYNIVESESDPLTRRAVDLFEKEPLKGNSEVHLHTPTKFGEDRSKDLGGDREQTDSQTNRQTDKRCSIYSMMHITGLHDKYIIQNLVAHAALKTVELQIFSSPWIDHLNPIFTIPLHLDFHSSNETNDDDVPNIQENTFRQVGLYSKDIHK